MNPVSNHFFKLRKFGEYVSSIFFTKQKTDETGEAAETGDKIFVWDHTYDRPQLSDRLTSVRFGGNSVIISNRYLPECRSKYHI